jgi:hypothetical protein
MKRIFAILLLVPFSVLAQPFWLNPDDYGGRGEHLGFSGAIGAGLTFEKPQWSALARFGACQVPGLLKEVVFDYGIMRSGVSRNDLRANAIGCVAGIGLAAGLVYVFRDRETTKVTYVSTF